MWGIGGYCLAPGKYLPRTNVAGSLRLLAAMELPAPNSQSQAAGSETMTLRADGVALSTGFAPPLVFAAFLLPAVLGYLYAKWYFHHGWGVGWKTSQFFFAYQTLGFVKRGLIGSLLHPFPPLLHGAVFLAISAILLLVFVGLFTGRFRRAARVLEPSGRRMLLALCALSPALFLHYGFDLGRFDVLGFLAVFGSLHALEYGHWWLAGLASAVALLAHEAYLVINFPLVLAFALTVRAPGPLRWRDWAWLILPSVFVSVAIAGAGLYELGQRALIETFTANPRYLATVGGVVDEDAIAVITRGMKENVEFVRRMFWEAKAFIHLPVIVLWTAVMTWFFHRFYRANGLRPGYLFYAAFTPLLLSAIACDHYRWVSLAATNMFIVFLLEIVRLARSGTRPILPGGWAAWILIASATFGPIGHAKSFPLLFQLLTLALTGELTS